MEVVGRSIVHRTDVARPLNRGEQSGIGAVLGPARLSSSGPQIRGLTAKRHALEEEVQQLQVWFPAYVMLIINPNHLGILASGCRLFDL